MLFFITSLWLKDVKKNISCPIEIMVLKLKWNKREFITKIFSYFNWKWLESWNSLVNWMVINLILKIELYIEKILDNQDWNITKQFSQEDSSVFISFFSVSPHWKLYNGMHVVNVMKAWNWMKYEEISRKKLRKGNLGTKLFNWK